jgi:hypothetical protein
VKINRARILNIKPTKPKLSGRRLNIDGQFGNELGNNNTDSLICKPDVKPTYFNASCSDSTGSNLLSFIFY